MKQKKPIIPSQKEIKRKYFIKICKIKIYNKKKYFYKFETDIFEKFKYLLEIENLGNKL